MSNIPISSLPLAITLDGSETVPIVQGGTTKRTTTGAISRLGFAGSTGSLTVNGTLTVLPTPATMNQGLVIDQTSPVGGSFPSTPFNIINVVDQGVTITGVGPDPDAFGLSNLNTMGFRVNYTTTNSQLRGALSGAVRIVGPTSSTYGVGGSVYTNVAAGGNLWGTIGITGIGPSGSANGMIALEGEAFIATGGSALYRAAVGANSQGPVRGSVLDTAFLITAGPNLGSASFDKIFSFSSQIYGSQSPVSSTTDIFYSDAPITIANVFNSSNWTLTGKFADFPNFTIDGATGRASFGVPLSSLPASYGLGISGASKGRAGFGVNTNTTTGSSFADIINSTGTAEVALLSNEAARTTVRYGRALGNYAELTAFSGNGLLIGTQTSTPIVFGTNNGFAGQVTSGKQWGLGADVTPIAGPILSLNQNTVAPTIAVDATPALQIVGATNAFAGLESDAFGISGQNVWTMRSAFGTAAAPTQVNLTAIIGTQQYRALDDTGAYRTVAAIDAVTTGAVTSTDWSGYFRIRTGTTGSALVERVRVQLGMNIGGTTDPGVGNLNLTGGSLLNNGTAPTGTGAYVRATSPAIASPTFSGTVVGAGTIPNSVLVNSSTTINGTAIALGASGTVAAAAGTLTGATLAANVLASSLTSVGTLTGGATGAGFTVALGSSTITGTLPLTNGGLAAALTASNGGIFYSTASAGAILSGTATARQMLQSGTSAAPAWSTTTWPATTTVNRLLWSSSANVISDLATANSSILVTDGSGVPSLSTTVPNGVTGTTQAIDDSTAKLATDAFVLNQAASATPLGNGTAAAGTSTRYARGDHVHPVDTRIGLTSASITGVNFNSANTDNAITVPLPPGYTRFELFRVLISHASGTLTTSTLGVFTATAGGGTALIPAGTANTVSTSADNTANNVQAINLAVAATQVAASLPTPNTIYFRVGTAQGSAATADVTFYYFPLP